MEVDASDIGVGAVLQQRTAVEQKLHPCAFFLPNGLFRPSFLHHVLWPRSPGTLRRRSESLPLDYLDLVLAQTTVCMLLRAWGRGCWSGDIPPGLCVIWEPNKLEVCSDRGSGGRPWMMTSRILSRPVPSEICINNPARLEQGSFNHCQFLNGPGPTSPWTSTPDCLAHIGTLWYSP